MLTPQAVGNTMPCPYCNGSRPELRMDGMNVKPARVRATCAFRPAIYPKFSLTVPFTRILPHLAHI